MGWNDTDHPLVFLFLGSSGIGIHVYPHSPAIFLSLSSLFVFSSLSLSLPLSFSVPLFLCFSLFSSLSFRQDRIS